MTDETLPKYQIIQQEILSAIAAGHYQDKLPSERALAERFGFSYMTVRKAINNLVLQGVLYKVPQKGIYVQHQQIKPLKQTIGYFLDQQIKEGIASPYYSMIYQALVNEAAKHDVKVVYFSDTQLQQFNALFDSLDGVIATCLPHNEALIAEIKRALPLVVIDNASEDKTIPSVIIDNFTADYNTVKYLAEMGHTTIGFMSGLIDSDVGQNRFRGYKYAMLDLTLPLEDRFVYMGNYSFESGKEGAEYFLSLDTLPSAIICANDSMALGAIQTFQNAGVKIPEQISIIGFDDIHVASQVSPALTTVAAPINEIAYHAFKNLNCLIHKQPLTMQHIALSATIKQRRTCQYRH